MTSTFCANCPRVEMDQFTTAGDHLLVTAKRYQRNVTWGKTHETSTPMVLSEPDRSCPPIAHVAALAGHGARFTAAGGVTNRVGQVAGAFSTRRRIAGAAWRLQQ